MVASDDFYYYPQEMANTKVIAGMRL